MDTPAGSLPPKRRVPQMRPRKPLIRIRENTAGDKRAKEREEVPPCRNVTMAPSDGCYVARKPLICSPKASVLKTPRPEKEKYASDKRTDEDEQLTQMKEDPVSSSLRDASPCSASNAGSCSPLSVSDLGGYKEHKDPSGPIFPRRSIQSSLSSSFLEIQKMERPVRRQLTSTCTPRCLSYPKGGPTELGRRSLGGQAMSSYEANYWDCAIPKSSHPTSNRQTADWDPDGEYQALLDYTYPLRPGQVHNELRSSVLQGDSLQQDPTWQDSGVEVDSLCRSTSLSRLDFSESRNKVWEMQYRTHSAEVSLDRSGKVSGHQDGGQPSSPSIAFIRTSLLPQSTCVDEDLDKEFLSLPERLEELHFLSRQVKEVTRSRERVESDTTSAANTTRVPEKKAAKRGEGRHEENTNVESVRKSSRSRMESLGGGRTHGKIQEAEVLVEQLCGFNLRETERSMLLDQDQDSCLVQHIHVFSSLLEQHIRWLYTLSDTTGVTAAPADGVPRSRAEYQTFQRDASGHQPLISRVLHTGEQLLSYMDATSPVLANALMLIEKQSGAPKKPGDNLTPPTHSV